MSSKNQIRQERRRKKREAKTRRKLNPAVTFSLAIGLILLVIMVAAYFLGGGPPEPGAVWSPEHQHWH